MPGLNRIHLIGRLGRDPETRFTSAGKNVCHFSLAVDRRWKTADGEVKEITDWFNVEAWGRLGEVCQAYLNKGRLVYLEGRLQTDRHEQDGDVKYFTKVILQNMQILERKSSEDLDPVEIDTEE